MTRISRDWRAILEFRFPELVAHDWAKGLAEKNRITLEHCRLEGRILRGPQNAWPAGPRRGLRGTGGQARNMRGPAGRRPVATKDGRVPNNSRCMVARCLPREVANNVRKVAQFNRPIFQSNLFKSSPNAVISLTGATASRLPSSCQ